MDPPRKTADTATGPEGLAPSLIDDERVHFAWGPVLSFPWMCSFALSFTANESSLFVMTRWIDL